MTGRIVYNPRAERQLNDLDEWISKAATPEIAQRFVEAVIAHIDSILLFPTAGRSRNDLRSGMRTTTYKKRTLIVYTVEDPDGAAVVVNVLGVFHGGQDWESALREDENDSKP